MTVWFDVPSYPVEIRIGDLLFIAGKQHPPIVKLKFEHVALVAQNRTVESREDLLNVPVFGLPESRLRLLPGLWYRTALELIESIDLTHIGSDETLWNLCSRIPAIDDYLAGEMTRGLFQRMGSMRCVYDEAFMVDETLSGPLATNCLGFVCSVLEHYELRILEHRLPAYDSPYEMLAGPLEDPCPGHLAYALHLRRPRFPWGTRSQKLARKYAMAGFTLSVARAQAGR